MRVLALSLLLSLQHPASSAFQGATKSEPFGTKNGMVDWELWLPAIETVESSNFCWAVSWRGSKHGRGLHQISEIGLREYKRLNPGMDWITHQMLFNSNISRPIALFLLRKHEIDFRKLRPNENPIPYVLSAYNQGAMMTLTNGINSEYVVEVLKSMK